jgi:hypothetical protein
VFTPRDWEVQLVGSHVPDLEFPCAMEPKRVEGLSWDEYNAFVRTIDAGFVLMDTPHPSYHHSTLLLRELLCLRIGTVVSKILVTIQPILLWLIPITSRL